MAKSISVSTRACIRCPVFGDPKELSCLVLPTYKDVMLQYFCIRNDIKNENQFDPSVKVIAQRLALIIIQIWEKASIPTVTKTRIEQKIRSYHDKYQKLIKPYKQRKNVPSYKMQLAKFEEDSKKLFDVAACKCNFNTCACVKSQKVSLQEQSFLSYEVRQFIIPKLNFDATDYTEMIQWNECKVTEPPILRSISDEVLYLCILGNAEIDIPEFACHTQGVERCVKIVTEAAASVFGTENRDGFIRSRLHSRAIMPKFEHKANYKVSNIL